MELEQAWGVEALFKEEGGGGGGRRSQTLADLENPSAGRQASAGRDVNCLRRRQRNPHSHVTIPRDSITIRHSPGNYYANSPT